MGRGRRPIVWQGMKGGLRQLSSYARGHSAPTRGETAYATKGYIKPR